MSAPSRSDVLQQGRWAVRTSTSRASFQARDVLRKPVLGTLPIAAGHVDVGAGGVPTAAWASLDLAGVDTGSARRDADLRGNRFFDAGACPTLVFSGGPAVERTDGTWVLPGALRLRGGDCPVELAVAVTAQPDGVRRVRATTSVDRRELGITVPRLLVGTAVHLVVEAELLAPAGLP